MKISMLFKSTALASLTMATAMMMAPEQSAAETSADSTANAAIDSAAQRGAWRQGRSNGERQQARGQNRETYRSQRSNATRRAQPEAREPLRPQRAERRERREQRQASQAQSGVRWQAQRPERAAVAPGATRPERSVSFRDQRRADMQRAPRTDETRRGGRSGYRRGAQDGQVAADGGSRAERLTNRPNRAYQRGQRYQDRRGYRNDQRYAGGRDGYNRDQRRYNGDNRGWDRGWHRNNRYNWRDYRRANRNRFNVGFYYSPYRNYSYVRFGIGGYLNSLFYGSRYWIEDPWSYRLPPAYGPYRWVRYYDDVLLVNIYTGQVVDVVYDFFW